MMQATDVRERNQMARLVRLGRNSAFGDVESEFQKLPVNSRSAPACILLYHPPDEGSNFGIDLRSAKLLWL